MLEISNILQAALIFITMILLTLAFFSHRIFYNINTRYLLFTGAGISVICLFFLESVLSHYLLKFYHFAGWSGYFLFLFLFFVLLTPFISALYRSIVTFKFKNTSPQLVIPQTCTVQKSIVLQDDIPESNLKEPLITEIVIPQKPEEEQKHEEIQVKEEVKSDKIKKPAVTKKKTVARKVTKTKKNTTVKKNTVPKNNPDGKKDTGGENAKH